MEEIIDKSGLDEVMNASSEGPVFIFKHSTTCPISSAAYREVSGYIESGEDDESPTVYLVKVIESRPISNAISDRTGVVHASPQLILVENGKAVWNASHYDINQKAIAKASGR